MDVPAPATIDAYIERFPPDVPKILRKLRSTVRQAPPSAQEAIKYGIPTFVLNGNLVHFAAYAKHIGFYPAPTGIARLRSEPLTAPPANPCKPRPARPARPAPREAEPSRLGTTMEPAPTPTRPPKAVARQLAKFYERNGYARKQNMTRFKREGSDQYKKGEEIRLIAESDAELALMQELLERAGFKPGRPFEKGAKICQPIYGKSAVARFLEMIAHAESG